MEQHMSPEKKILNDAFITWYNSRYKELIASELLEKWSRLDTVIQIGIAVTAGGSAVAGWQFWHEPRMKIAWTVISGIVSLMAIGHKGFRVVDKVKVWSEAKQAFTMLRNQLETLRYEVKTSFEKDRDNIDKKYLEIKKVFTDEDTKAPDKDPWLTNSLVKATVSKVYDSPQKTNFEEELRISKSKYLSGLEKKK